MSIVHNLSDFMCGLVDRLHREFFRKFYEKYMENQKWENLWDFFFDSGIRKMFEILYQKIIPVFLTSDFSRFLFHNFFPEMMKKKIVQKIYKKKNLFNFASGFIEKITGLKKHQNWPCAVWFYRILSDFLLFSFKNPRIIFCFCTEKFTIFRGWDQLEMHKLKKIFDFQFF